MSVWNWDDVAVWFSYRELATNLSIVCFFVGVLIYGVLGILNDQHNLREENKRLRDEIKKFKEIKKAPPNPGALP